MLTTPQGRSVGLLWLASVFGTAAIFVMASDPAPLVIAALLWLFRAKILGNDTREKLFLIALLLRCAILVVSTETYSSAFGIPVIYTGGDSESHYALAERLTRDFKWSNLWSPPLESSRTFAAGTYHFGPLVVFHTGYVFFLSMMGHFSDFLFAHSKYTFIFGDAVIGSMIPVLTYDIAAKMSPDPETPVHAGFLMAFYPLAIILSGIFMKDSLATFLLLVMVKAMFYSEKKHYLLTFIAWCWLIIVRYKSGVFLLPLLILKWLFPKPIYGSWAEFRNEFTTLRFKAAAAVMVIPALIFASKLNLITVLVNIFVSTQEIMERTTVQGLTLIVYGLPGPLKPMGMLAMAMIMPVPPWRSLGVPDKFFLYSFFSDLGALYWYACIPFVLVGLHVVVKDRKHDIMAAGAFAFIMISMALSYWVDDRRRLMALPFGFILCSIGFKARERYGYFLSGIMGLALFSGLTYVAMKT
jgi:hypothetical protein